MLSIRDRLYGGIRQLSILLSGRTRVLAVVVFDVVVPDLERLQEIDEPRAGELWDLLDHVPLSQ